MRYADFKLERYFAKHEFTSKYLLCVSDCESHSVNELLELSGASMDDMGELRLGYTETLGNPDLRREISALYEKSRPEDVMVIAGAEEGIFLVMKSVLQAGDHIIVQYPCYQSLYGIAKGEGIEVTKWMMDSENGWKLSFDELEATIKDNTRMIVINYPHNPTGAIIAHEEYTKLIDIAKKHNIIIFSDEVYRFGEYNESDRLPAMADMYENGISLGVMSKSLGLAGLRIGWLVTKNQNLFNQISPIKDFTTICSSAPSEYLSIVALGVKEKILQRNNDLIASNIKLFDEFLEKHQDKLSWTRPKGSPIGFVKLHDGAISQFTNKLLQDTGVLLLPASEYNYDKPYFRIGFGRKDFAEGLKVFDEWISAR